MSRVDRVPFGVPDITEVEVEAAARAIRSGWVTSGPEMAAFEKEFSQHLGGTETVAVNSATAGLHLAVEACGIGPGDEVIVPTWTFTATAEVVRYVGAIPVIVDVDRATLNIDFERVADVLSAKTKAVIPVHMAGQGVDVSTLRDVVGPSVRIIEDAAHALPTVTRGTRVGSCEHSDAAVFSFYATKTLCTGEGGMIATRDSGIAARARVMRLHGIDRDAFDRYRSGKPAWYYDIVAAGFKYNLTDPAAAMGRVQLSRLREMHERRQQVAGRYLRAFSDLPVDLPQLPPSGDTHAWHLFIIGIGPEAPIDRDGFISALAAHRVGTSVHFIPLHRHSYWRRTLGLTDSRFPIATDRCGAVASLPLFSAMTDDQVTRVIDVVREVLA